MMYGTGGMGLGGLLVLLTWLVFLADGILLAVWLWKHIKK
jgi:hypothetical protein